MCLFRYLTCIRSEPNFFLFSSLIILLLVMCTLCMYCLRIVPKDPRFDQSADRITGYLTSSMLAVPVKDQNSRLLLKFSRLHCLLLFVSTDCMLGVIQATNHLPDGPFSEEDHMVMTSLANAAGMTIRISLLIFYFAFLPLRFSFSPVIVLSHRSCSSLRESTT